MLNMKEFGSLISANRKKANLTQEAFAAKLGITPQAVSKWENGVGYPDITLVPAISDILNIPIEQLFGDKPGEYHRFHSFPAELNSLKLIYSVSDKACYSSKEIAEISEKIGRITFTDGSYANLDEGLVCNKGVGEIRILELDKIKPLAKEETIDRVLNDFHSISISNSLNLDIKIIKASDCIPRLKAKGSNDVIAHLTYEVIDGTFTLKTEPIKGENARCEVEIHVPFSRGRSLKCSISGCGDCTVEPDFDTARISIVGCGDVSGNGCGIFEAKITGSGDANFKNVEETATINITGSGDVNLNKASEAKIKITGSGDVEIGELKDAGINITGSGYVKTKLLGGDLSVKIVGSGDVTAAGEAQKLFCDLLGSGACLNGAKLSVTDAEIRINDSAEVHLAAIKGQSIEIIKSKATLTVDKRG